jgi:gliding motility-associated-like protein
MNSKIYIFDRFGNLIKEINKTNTGWDGTFNKQMLPSTDYWFLLEATNGKNIKGHFSLKR